MTTTSEAYQSLKTAICNDPEMAWAWQSNFACCAMNQGISHETANKIAACIMAVTFDVDITQHPYYKDFNYK